MHKANQNRHSMKYSGKYHKSRGKKNFGNDLNLLDDFSNIHQILRVLDKKYAKRTLTVVASHSKRRRSLNVKIENILNLAQSKLSTITFKKARITSDAATLLNVFNGNAVFFQDVKKVDVPCDIAPNIKRLVIKNTIQCHEMNQTLSSFLNNRTKKSLSIRNSRWTRPLKFMIGKNLSKLQITDRFIGAKTLCKIFKSLEYARITDLVLSSTKTGGGILNRLNKVTKENKRHNKRQQNLKHFSIKYENVMPQGIFMFPLPLSVKNIRYSTTRLPFDTVRLLDTFILKNTENIDLVKTNLSNILDIESIQDYHLTCFQIYERLGYESS